MEEKAKRMALAAPVEGNQELGITQTYNQENRNKLWDSAKGKQEYKDKVFDGKKTYKDPISGKILHVSQKAAQNKHHMKNAKGENHSTAWADHAAETDHIVALKEVHERTKGNAFLKDQDLKEIANQDYNYRVTSKRFNATKGKKSDFAMAADKEAELSREARKTLVQEKVNAELRLNLNVAGRTAKNMGTEFVNGARQTVEASLVPLTAEAVRQLCEVARGEESLGEAVGNMGKLSVDLAVTGGVKRLITDSSRLLKDFASSDQINQFIAVGLIIKESAERYLNGEIDGQGFIEEIGEKGCVLVAGMVGGEIGREIGGALGLLAGGAGGLLAGELVGKVMGALITTVACGAIMTIQSVGKDIKDTAAHLEDYKKKERELARVKEEALAEMKRQREKLQDICKEEYGKWDQEISEGFDQIMCHACEGVYSAEGVAGGLDKILGLFGKSVRFKTVDEYEAQLGTELELEF